MKPLSWARLLALTAFGFALTLVSNTLDPAIYGHTILEIAPENPNTVLGFATAAGSILSIFLAPVIGALSDRTRSRWASASRFLSPEYRSLLLACWRSVSRTMCRYSLSACCFIAWGIT